MRLNFLSDYLTQENDLLFFNQEHLFFEDNFLPFF